MIQPRHTALVRITHWLTAVSFAALLVTGLEIVVSHPRFYWGETGNVNMHPAFTLPLATSRGTVNNGYGSSMPDQNGWSRSLHFEAAWLLVLTGAVYLAAGVLSGHFRRHLLPLPGQRSLRHLLQSLARDLRRPPPDTGSYNVLQRTAYLAVIFVLFPLVVWTGLALSPAFVSALPATVELLGGRQTARTLHFFLTWALVLFLATHLIMIAVHGFWRLTRAMITGRAAPPPAALPEDHS